MSVEDYTLLFDLLESVREPDEAVHEELLETERPEIEELAEIVRQSHPEQYYLQTGT